MDVSEAETEATPSAGGSANSVTEGETKVKTQQYLGEMVQVLSSMYDDVLS